MYVQLLDLNVGSKVLMHDGVIAEIVSNPKDGIWVETKIVVNGVPEGEPTMTHCQEIKEIIK